MQCRQDRSTSSVDLPWSASRLPEYFHEWHDKSLCVSWTGVRSRRAQPIWLDSNPITDGPGSDWEAVESVCNGLIHSADRDRNHSDPPSISDPRDEM